MIEFDEGVDLLSTEEAIEGILQALDDANEDLTYAYNTGKLSMREYREILRDASEQAAMYIEILKREGKIYESIGLQ